MKQKAADHASSVAGTVSTKATEVAAAGALHFHETQSQVLEAVAAQRESFPERAAVARQLVNKSVTDGIEKMEQTREAVGVKMGAMGAMGETMGEVMRSVSSSSTLTQAVRGEDGEGVTENSEAKAETPTDSAQLQLQDAMTGANQTMKDALTKFKSLPALANSLTAQASQGGNKSLKYFTDVVGGVQRAVASKPTVISQSESLASLSSTGAHTPDLVATILVQQEKILQQQEVMMKMLLTLSARAESKPEQFLTN